MRVQRGFNLDRVDVEPARDDHVLLAVDDEQKPIAVEVPEVTRLPEAIGKLRGCALGIVVVARIVARERNQTSPVSPTPRLFPSSSTIISSTPGVTRPAEPRRPDAMAVRWSALLSVTARCRHSVAP